MCEQCTFLQIWSHIRISCSKIHTYVYTLGVLLLHIIHALYSGKLWSKNQINKVVNKQQLVSVLMHVYYSYI